MKQNRGSRPQKIGALQITRCTATAPSPSEIGGFPARCSLVSGPSVFQMDGVLNLHHRAIRFKIPNSAFSEGRMPQLFFKNQFAGSRSTGGTETTCPRPERSESISIRRRTDP